MKKLFAIMAFVAAFAAVRGQGVSWGGDVVQRTSCVDNDTLRVELVSVENPSEPQPRYVQDWVNIVNKTDDTLHVTYHVEALLTRYDKPFSYDYTLSVGPRNNLGDNVYSHFHKGHYIFGGQYRDTDCKVKKIYLLHVK